MSGYANNGHRNLLGAAKKLLKRIRDRGTTDDRANTAIFLLRDLTERFEIVLDELDEFKRMR